MAALAARSNAIRDMDIDTIRSTVLTTPEWLTARAHEWALFIDIDGTLLEMAPTPDAVVVPAGLVQMLDDLARTMGGAIALSTGRSVAEADRLLFPLKLITSGVHGTEVRVERGGEVTMMAPAVSATLLDEIVAVAAMSPGIIVEVKGAGVAVHYRKVPELRPALEVGLSRSRRASRHPCSSSGAARPRGDTQGLLERCRFGVAHAPPTLRRQAADHDRRRLWG